MIDWLADFSVPHYPILARKEKEKVEKYKDLAANVAPVHMVSVEVAGVHKVSVVVLIAVGWLGVFTKDLTRWLKKIGVVDVVVGLQTSAVIGTASILRKVVFKSAN